IKGFKDLDSIFDDDELIDICEVVEKVDSEERSTCLLDVFLKLRSGDVRQAKKRINLYKDKHILVEQLKEEEVKEVKPGEDFFDFEDFDPEFMESYLKSSGFKEWMLFLHPEQKK